MMLALAAAGKMDQHTLQMLAKGSVVERTMLKDLFKQACDIADGKEDIAKRKLRLDGENT